MDAKMLSNLLRSWLKENGFDTIYVLSNDADELVFIMCDDTGIKCYHKTDVLIAYINNNEMHFSKNEKIAVQLSDPTFFDILKSHLSMHINNGSEFNDNL